jgi:hypothetical protein
MKLLVNHRLIRWLSLWVGSLGLFWLGTVGRAIAQAPTEEPPDTESLFLRPPTTCPADLPTLITGLLRDLPGYANRVAHRSLGIAADDTGFGTILVAGQAEFDPLDITPLTFDGHGEPSNSAVQQVFFTTLERHYTAHELVQLEQYHWLFVVPSDDGWYMVLLFSRTAPHEGTRRPPTPPRENSDGIIGQAVRLWLRDCRAGAIYPVETGGEVDDRDR